MYEKELRPELKGNDPVSYNAGVNLLDLAVIQAERANIFKEHPDSIKKVSLLLKKGANALSCNNFCGQNYLHQVSHPLLIRMFAEAGVDVKARKLLLKHWKDHFRPIDAASYFRRG